MVLARGDVRQGIQRGPRCRCSSDLEFAQHVDAAITRPVGEGTAQGGGLHLLRCALGIVARLRAMYHATTNELGGADRALACAAGALLAPRLTATTGNIAASFRRVRSLAGGWQVSRR